MQVSDGMKIAVLASHAPESIRNVVRLAAGPANGSIEWRARTCQSFFNLSESSTRMVEEWSRSSANATPMDVDGLGKGKGKGMLRVRTSLPSSERLQVQSSQRARAKAKERQRVPRPTRTLQPSLKECRHCGKKGHKWADCRKRLAEAKDKKVMSLILHRRNDRRYAIVVQDLATQWIQSFPCKTKTSQGTQKELAKVPGTRKES